MFDLDLERAERCGYPEVVYGPGKTVDQLGRIFRRLSAEYPLLATRLDDVQLEAMRAEFPQARVNAAARTFRLASAAGAWQCRPGAGRVAVITAGTGDLPVAEEARETLDWMGARTNLIVDVGVAGPHRLPNRLSEFAASDAIVVVAGMEGALPSVVAGYVKCPVIAVPTSVGYGANFGGISALLSMMNSCAANVAVVNIDAGFKAGYMAGLIAQQRS